ncbi:DedA family protein [Fusobacterium perfoetens]|uniref:DedA family protein n=1 Tax=Fusobacterium perfoetens TaxID=852 RepID=UPI001F26BB7A|nr:DedA family protein [Fusobacterium perfoetens]MCF2611504.1 DedA family protein [Fusobacterium perfoetens]
MEDYILNVLSKFSYLGIFFLIFIENVFPPIPSELILVFGGFISKSLNLNFLLLVIFATLGSSTGAIILYYAGKKIPLEKMESFLEKKWVKRLGFKPGDIKKSLKYFEKYSTFAVFFGRCIPVVRSLISIPAGMQNMSLRKFLIYTTIGSGIWNTLLIYIGRVTQDKWKEGLLILERYSNRILGLIILAFVIKFLVKRFLKKRKKSEEGKDE